MHPSIAVFFLIGTIALLITTVASGRPRPAMFRALAWSATASLASTFVWDATSEIPPLSGESGAAPALQIAIYGFVALALWIWSDAYASDLEHKQYMERWRQEIDEESRRIDQREARLEAEKQADREAEEAREEQQRRDEHKRKMKQLRDARERRRQEASDNYNKARKELREQLNYAKTTVPEEAKYQELGRVKKEIATYAKECGVSLAAFRYDKDGDRIVVKPQEGGRSLPVEFQEQANRLLDNDDVREIYNHQDPIRQTLKDWKQTTEALRWEMLNMIP